MTRPTEDTPGEREAKADALQVDREEKADVLALDAERIARELRAFRTEVRVAYVTAVGIAVAALFFD